MCSQVFAIFLCCASAYPKLVQLNHIHWFQFLYYFSSFWGLFGSHTTSFLLAGAALLAHHVPMFCMLVVAASPALMQFCFQVFAVPVPLHCQRFILRTLLTALLACCSREFPGGHPRHSARHLSSNRQGEPGRTSPEFHNAGMQSESDVNLSGAVSCHVAFW